MKSVNGKFKISCNAELVTIHFYYCLQRKSKKNKKFTLLQDMQDRLLRDSLGNNITEGLKR